MQETSNIIPYNICKGQIFEEINKGTAWHTMAQHGTAWHSMAQHYGTAGGGRGGGVSPRKSVVQSACQYDATSRVSNFQNGEQSARVHRRDG